jgi:hypothetical protein
MMSPIDLLERAESLAARIPTDQAFEEEREISWELVGRGYLRSGDAAGAARALRQMANGEASAALRWDFVKWVPEHPQSAIGLHILRETVDQIAQWESCFPRFDFWKLTSITYRILGERAVRKMTDDLQDLFTKTIVLAEWARLVSDAELRRELLTEAEEAANHTPPGNRDWALDWLRRTHLDLRSDADPERIRSLMGHDADASHTLIRQATDLLEKVKEIYPRPEDVPDSSAGRLSRFLRYRYNDLKVHWLVNQAARGGLDDPHLEEQLDDELFLRIESPRQPSIHKDPSHLEPVDFAAFFFSRAVHSRESDRELVEGNVRYGTMGEDVHLISAATRLFLDFGAVSRNYSEDQIEQGLWSLFGYPYFFFEEVMNGRVSRALRDACLKAMVAPFRDYYQTAEGYSGSAFYMWWDHHRGWEDHADALPAAMTALQQIMVLPDKKCQFAAVHGLNHLQAGFDASAIVERYLAVHRSELTPEEIEWVEMCREGKAL